MFAMMPSYGGRFGYLKRRAARVNGPFTRDELGDAGIDEFLARAVGMVTLSPPFSQMVIFRVGQGIAAIPGDATAFSTATRATCSIRSPCRPTRPTTSGCDLAADAIERARKEAADAGLTNVRFEQQDVAALGPDEPFDAVISFDTVHDLPDPGGFLRAVHRSLAPGGRYLMMEPKASSNLEDNIGHPMAPLLYAVSTLHCLTVSLAEGGAGLGTAFGEQKAIELLTEAGFTDITVTPAPGDPLGGVFVATRPAV
jgi:SAM-dependent methyltransferase